MKWIRIITLSLLSILTACVVALLVLILTKKDANDIYLDTYKSVVEVKACNEKGCSYGSGVIISDDGKIVSNNHVISYDGKILVLGYRIVMSIIKLKF